MKNQSKLGIVAGSGMLPQRLISFCQKYNRPYFVLALEHQAEDHMAQNTPHAWVRLGEVGKALEILKTEGVQEIVMAGGIRRPSWSDLRPDFLGSKWLARIGMKAFGDDGILSGIIQELEKEGFSVIGADSLLEDLKTPFGSLGIVMPTPEDINDIKRGFEVLMALGSQDVGQAVVVEQGIVIGIEAIEGTAGLLNRCGPLKREKKAGVLIKASKPFQEQRVDLPAIGSDTIQQAYDCGLNGIAIEAERSCILHQTLVIEMANKLGIFVYGFDPTTF
jgi:DUF1009 family protein